MCQAVPIMASASMVHANARKGSLARIAQKVRLKFCLLFHRNCSFFRQPLSWQLCTLIRISDSLSYGFHIKYSGKREASNTILNSALFTQMKSLENKCLSKTENGYSKSN